MEATIQQKTVTYDFERQMQGATKVRTSEFAGTRIDRKMQGSAGSGARTVEQRTKRRDSCERKSRSSAPATWAPRRRTGSQPKNLPMSC